MSDRAQRFTFGLLAFTITAAVIIYAMSPYVPDSKEKIAYLIVGNVLGWPFVILSWFFGSSHGSQQMRDIIQGNQERMASFTSVVDAEVDQ